MKVFQLKSFYNTSALLKKELFVIALLFCLLNLNAQVKNNIKLGIEPGVLLLSDSENLGLFLNAELKLKSSKNTFIGLRIGFVLNSQAFENYDSLQFNIDDKSDNGGISLVPTIDYYFKKSNFKERKFRPYIGAGVGYYLLANYIDVSRTVITNPSEDEFEVYVDNQVGFLLRTGLESGKLRIGLEYNFILKADIEIPNGPVIGTVDNSYLGLSIGFILGDST